MPTFAPLSLVLLVVVYCGMLVLGGNARKVRLLSHDWRFKLVPKNNSVTCRSTDFPITVNGHRCSGLQEQGRPEDGGPASPSDCRIACCEDDSCNVWQWCPNCTSLGSCWLGSLSSIAASCSEFASGWQGAGRSRVPSGPQPGAPCDEPECQQLFDDSGWRSLSVPHDFVIEGSFSRTADKSHGYLTYAKAWYRKTFFLPSGKKHRPIVWLDFEGVMVRSQVWLNGVFIGSHDSGYTPFHLPFGSSSPLSWDANNVLVVKVDASALDGWWYDGGGIYRNVWLTILDSVHIAHWGVYAPAVVTGVVNNTTQTADAELRPSIEISNEEAAKADISILGVVYNARGDIVVSSYVNATIASATVLAIFLPPLLLPTALLWSPEAPVLYTLVVNIHDHQDCNRLVDSLNTTFGVRKTAWDATRGFILNGVPTKILGVANHQDFAGVGVAVPDSLQRHRVRKLKEFGANAWRTAHNPPNTALLDATDQEGMLVWDENHRNGQKVEMETLIRRDRNHPSIIVWSACNEALCNTDDTMGDVTRFKSLVHELDPMMGRVVSANSNHLNGPGTPLDLQGIDYDTQSYDAVHIHTPHIPAISSETSSAVSDRGEYNNDPLHGHVTGYDTEAPSWGDTAEVAWQSILARPFIAGGFTWTGWDYRGEPTPYAWPDVNSHFGVLDLAGFWKDRAHWYRACWAPLGSAPVLHLLPHWNWNSSPCIGSCQVDSAEHSTFTIDVWAFSTAEEVELIHPNGTSLGRKRSTPCSHVAWPKVPYVPGRVNAHAFENGRIVATSTIETTGAPAALKLKFKDGVGEQGVKAGGGDVALVFVEVVDSQGRLVPTATDTVTFTVASCNAKVVGTANGDPASLVPNTSPSRPAFHGLVMAVIRPASRVGTVTVNASAPGLSSSSLRLRILANDDHNEMTDSVASQPAASQVFSLVTCRNKSQIHVGLTSIHV